MIEARQRNVQDVLFKAHDAAVHHSLRLSLRSYVIASLPADLPVAGLLCCACSMIIKVVKIQGSLRSGRTDYERFRSLASGWRVLTIDGAEHPLHSLLLSYCQIRI